jgi:starch synthase
LFRYLRNGFLSTICVLALNPRIGEKKGMKRVESLKILFAASECAPLAKAGGLGDVVAGLAKELKNAGHDVRIFLPLYGMIQREKNGIRLLGSSCVHLGGVESWVAVYGCELDGLVPVWLLEHEGFFGRSGIYDESNSEYGDNAYRYALFSKACLQVCKDLNWIPDVMHLHDWATAPAAAYLKTWDRKLSPLSKTASVLTIHNIGYQGVYDAGVIPFMGFGAEQFQPQIFEDHGRVNLLKAGIWYADAITTVSPTHAAEILTPEGGRGLAPYLNARRGDVFGILNGADYSQWNPAHDRLIPASFSAEDLSGKAACKKRLRQDLGLVETEAPLIGLVSRLVEQKGTDLLRGMLTQALERMDFQLVLLGSGDVHMQDYFLWLGKEFSGKVSATIGFSNELSHQIVAGSDFFLMPSIYEPCGLTQLYSLRYGTLPIARETGGLKDTVKSYNFTDGSGTGFTFAESSPEALTQALGLALDTWFHRPEHIELMQQEAMACDFSWDKSIPEYVRVYQQAIQNRRKLQESELPPARKTLGRNFMLEALDLRSV